MTGYPAGGLSGLLGGVLVCGSIVAFVGSVVSRSRFPERRLAGLGPSLDTPGAGTGTRLDGRIDLEVTAGLTERLAALLEAGLPVRECWLILAEPGTGAFDAGTARTARVARIVADVVTSGGSVGDGLRLAARAARPGRRMALRRCPAPDGLAWLAAVWDVTQECGAAPSGVLRAVARALRDERDLRAAVEAASAGPRATVLVLAGMPLAVSGLGASLGADPVGVLFGTAVGRGCLVVGTTLWAAGLLWAYRLTGPR